ncbi:chloride channel protein [Paeniglutamicibacter kerguelensis]|uniref:H+/Cl- antiporter ClcA n=1 Tax=Paeniglutamicibacter kerguelensis TaxID=254788 RepID=A0ABS4XCW8_9MICC|nr:chloride channel protein [Paeniglutamicibacter kerguelensis]MBP2386206.1 H+/Cl- antiporter ClcA [Paeniglutamicibacter kerguelensis]
MSEPAASPPSIDPVAVIRSKPYIAALVLAAVLGVPISVIAYGFLALVAALQRFVFVELPGQVLGGPAPAWWPVPWLVLCGLLTALTIRYLPGTGGHSPAFGFKMGGGPPSGRELVGIVLAALTTLSLGAVLGPEGPLVAIGGGLGALAVHLVKKDAPPMAPTIMASAGSFAAVSTLLGSPVLGAFLIMEAAGIGGMTLSLVALPGLLASGVGALVFVGLDGWTGLGSFSLALPVVPPAVPPTLAALGWAVVMGAVGALLGWLIRWVALSLRPVVHLNRVLVTSALGLLIGLTAMAYQLISGQSFTQVLFSGQDELPELVEQAADYSLAVLVLLIACKTLVYGLSLSAFRGGPVFPAMFIGAALGIAASGLPGMDLASGIGMGMGAMCAAMLRLPLTSTLLATLLLGVDGVAVTPQVVVAVAVAFVITTVLPVPGPRASVAPDDVGSVQHWAPSRADHATEISKVSRSTIQGRWIAWLFIIGSSLFALGAVPLYAEAVGLRLGAATFFVGSLFFTSAAFLQYRGAVEALPAVGATRRHSFWVWAPHNLGWLAAAVQLAGTLWFNWSTANALQLNLSAELAEQRVWRPDALGSIAFLIASGVALRDAGRAIAGRRWHRTWKIAVINVAGSVAFGISAVAAFVIPSSGDVWNAELSNLGTFVGALCFLTGAILMLRPESTDAPVPADRGTHP